MDKIYAGIPGSVLGVIPQHQWNEAQAKSAAHQQEQHLRHSQAMQQSLGNQIAPVPMGILAMTENAHEAFQRLSNALGELRDRLNPLTEPYPEPCEKACTTNQIAEASAVVGLRTLVERIDTKTAEIHRLLSALRV